MDILPAHQCAGDMLMPRSLITRRTCEGQGEGAILEAMEAEQGRRDGVWRQSNGGGMVCGGAPSGTASMHTAVMPSRLNAAEPTMVAGPNSPGGSLADSVITCTVPPLSLHVI